jgi:phosphohistidine swiveling domain-containing protein
VTTTPRQTTHVVDSRDSDLEETLVGGKAARLAQLGAAGFPVPPWFCLTTALYGALVTSLRSEIEASLVGLRADDRAAVAAVSARLRALVSGASFAETDRAAIFGRWNALLAPDARVAVRSSVVGEDSASDSFAGQMDTFLCVGRAELLERALACFASAFSERALAYRLLRGKQATPVAAAVVVQLMVDARTAGVLFTANPTTGDRNQAVISAGLGLGEGVVSGTVETDTYHAALDGGRIVRREIVAKHGQVAFDRTAGQGTSIHATPVELAERPALSDAEVAALCALGQKVQEGAGGAPQDIEWAIDAGGKLYLLQARPVTALARGREQIFDNSNIVESYPGLILPLTFSQARRGYEIIFSANARLLGADDAFLRKYGSYYANLVGLLDGRLYYNLVNFYSLFLFVPGFEWVLPAWEKALGLSRMPRPKERTGVERLRGRYWQMILFGNILRLSLRLDHHIRGFFAELADVQREVGARPLAELSAHELVELEEQASTRLMVRYAISPFNDSFGQQLHEAVGKLIARYGLGDPMTLRNQLLCGEEGMESVAPVRSIIGLAEAIRALPTLRELFAGERSPLEVWKAVQEDASFTAFRAQLSEHIRRYGDRTLQELKLETSTLEDDPSFLVVMLRNYLRGGQDNARMSERERELRANAETQVNQKLRWRPLRRALFGYSLQRLRHAVRDRENLRFARTRVVAMQRRIFRELGRQLAKAGLLDDHVDVHYLTVDELAAVVRGQSVNRDLRALVSQRRADYEAYAQRRPPARVTTRGIVHAADVGEDAAAAPSADGVLRGTGCSPGRVTATAKVVLDPRANLEVQGEILVAPSTDPGWVFLMVAASGLVAEKGSLLSHTAIIGRELGIPTVVGVKDATRLIHDGATIVLDGQRGTIELVRE